MQAGITDRGAAVAGRRSAILFDLDGVLIDSEPAHYAAEVEVLGRYGYELHTDFWHTLKGTTEEQFVRAVRAHGIDPPVPDRQLIAETRSALLRILPEIGKPFPGARQTVQSFHAHELGLVTSSARAFTRLALELVGLAGAFDVIVTGEDVERGKPDPEPYTTAALRLGRPPAACLVIEDSINGVRSAVASGATCIAVEHSFPRSRLGEAHFVVSELAQVPPLVARLEQSAPRGEPT